MKKQTIPKDLSFLIKATVIFLLFSFWWYGFFPEIGKRKEPYTPGESMKYNDYWEASYNYYDPYLDKDEKIDKKTFTEIRRKYVRAFRQEIAHLSTDALIETVIDHINYLTYLYGYPESLYEFPSTVEEDGYPMDIIRELFSRNNAGKKLLALYSESIPVDQSLFDDWAKMELLLAQPAIRLHLTPQDLELLSEAIYKKQWEKYSEISIAYEPHNFLYIGAYDENGWDEEKLKEYAEIYERPFVEAGREEPKEVHFAKRRQQKILNGIQENTHQRWERFDECNLDT